VWVLLIVFYEILVSRGDLFKALFISSRIRVKFTRERPIRSPSLIRRSRRRDPQNLTRAVLSKLHRPAPLSVRCSAITIGAETL
jgi:hypothetical protein